MKTIIKAYNKFVDLWDFLNGKKTIIGAALHFIVYVIKGLETYFGINIIPNSVLVEGDTIADYIITVGFAHKFYKLVK